MSWEAQLRVKLSLCAGFSTAHAEPPSAHAACLQDEEDDYTGEPLSKWVPATNPSMAKNEDPAENRAVFVVRCWGWLRTCREHVLNSTANKHTHSNQTGCCAHVAASRLSFCQPASMVWFAVESNTFAGAAAQQQQHSRPLGHACQLLCRLWCGVVAAAG